MDGWGQNPSPTPTHGWMGCGGPRRRRRAAAPRRQRYALHPPPLFFFFWIFCSQAITMEGDHRHGRPFPLFDKAGQRPDPRPSPPAMAARAPRCRTAPNPNRSTSAGPHHQGASPQGRLQQPPPFPCALFLVFLGDDANSSSSSPLQLELAAILHLLVCKH